MAAVNFAHNCADFGVPVAAGDVDWEHPSNCGSIDKVRWASLKLGGGGLLNCCQNQRMDIRDVDFIGIEILCNVLDGVHCAPWKEPVEGAFGEHWVNLKKENLLIWKTG